MPNVTLASHNRGIIPIIGEIASVNLVGMDDRVVVGRMTSVTVSSLSRRYKTSDGCIRSVVEVGVMRLPTDSYGQ